MALVYMTTVYSFNKKSTRKSQSDGTICLEMEASAVGISHPMQMLHRYIFNN